MIASVLEPRLLEILASSVTALMLWARGRQHKAVDPVEDLIERCQHPIRWRLRHPVQAVKRAIWR